MARPKDRAERMAIVAEMERKEKTKRMGKSILIGLLVIAGVAAAGYGIYKLPSPPKIVHWHAKFEVYVNGQHEDFSAFHDVSRNNDGKLYEPAHLHQPTNIIHNEAKEGQGTMGKFFQYHLGGKLSNDEMLIPSGASVPGDFKNDANNTLKMFLDQTPFAKQTNESNWQPVSDIPNYSFHDGDRILLVYGSGSADEIAALEKSFPTFNPKTVT